MSGRDAAQLLRLPVSLMVAAATAFGWLLVQPRLSAELGWALLGSALLAGACSACNQAQEKDTDALLPRTKDRPLPSGRMRTGTALVISAIVFTAACLCLRQASGTAADAAGLALVGWAFGIALVYNGLYTPLKRKTGLALLPGALVGATPPLLGWVGAGGNPLDPMACALYGLYVLWQVPHFLLRVEKDQAAYAAARLPLPAMPRFSGPMLSVEFVDGGMALAMALILTNRLLVL